MQMMVTKYLDSIYLDRGGLKYPSIELVSRLWTVYKFVVAVLPLISGSTYIRQDLVQFLSLKLKHCSTFQCELLQHGDSNETLFELCLKKFLSPILCNKAEITQSLNN